MFFIFVNDKAQDLKFTSKEEAIKWISEHSSGNAVPIGFNLMEWQDLEKYTFYTIETENEKVVHLLDETERLRKENAELKSQLAKINSHLKEKKKICSRCEGYGCGRCSDPQCRGRDCEECAKGCSNG